MRGIIILLASVLVLTGCRDDVTGPRDHTPPAAPRGVRSVTGDHTAYLSWLDNTEPDVAGYRIYESPCETGPNCPYERIGTTGGTTFEATGLANGVTRFFAVAAYDYAGNESALSYETVYDTPRPEGFGARLSSYLANPAAAGWDLSAAQVRAFNDATTDMFYGENGTTLRMFVPDFATEIQDAGYTSSLYDVDFAPSGGWSPTGSVELIEGHSYVVRTRDDHYAKFRVTRVLAQPTGPPRIEFDWAYQVDQNNRELRARPVREEGTGPRPITWTP